MLKGCSVTTDKGVLGLTAAGLVLLLIALYLWLTGTVHASEDATCSPTLILTAVPTVTGMPTMQSSPTAGASAMVSPTGQMPLGAPDTSLRQ